MGEELTVSVPISIADAEALENGEAILYHILADGLIERPSDANDNTTPDDNDDGFDGETEYN